MAPKSSLLVILAALPGTAAAGAAVLLADSVQIAQPLSDNLVLCTGGEDGGFFTVSIPSGARAAWTPSWQPDEDGWEGMGDAGYDGYPFVLSVSPDLEHVVFARSVYLPDRCKVPDGMDAMRSCFVVVLCDADGSDASPVAVGLAVGGGPEYDFTSDSRRLVGQPFYPCPPTPEGYSGYLRRGWDYPSIPEFDYVDVETGLHGTIPDLSVGDGFWKCPYSDYFRIENNWYEEHDFSSFETGGLVGHYSVPDGEGFIRGWVLPDAVLMAGPGNWRVVFVDGTVVQGPPMSWDLYSWLPDGTYLFSTDGGGTVLHGRVDWTTGRVSGAMPCPGLEAFTEESFIPLPGSEGILIHSPATWGSGDLLYYGLP
jgi:hypothetical protein